MVLVCPVFALYCRDREFSGYSSLPSLYYSSPLTRITEIYIRIWLQDAPSNKLYIFGMIGVLCYALVSDAVTYWCVNVLSYYDIAPAYFV